MRRLHIVLMVAAGWLAVEGARSAGADQPKKEARDARGTAEAFLAAALEGKAKEAAALGEPGQSPSREEKVQRELTDGLATMQVGLVSVHVSGKGNRALVITDTVQLAEPNPDGRDKGQLVLTLTRKGKRWLVRDIDFESEESAKEELKRFLKEFPDARHDPDRKRK